MEKPYTSTKQQAKEAFKAREAIVHVPVGNRVPYMEIEEVSEREPVKVDIPSIELSVIRLTSFFIVLASIAIWGITPLNVLARGFFDFGIKTSQYWSEGFGDLRVPLKKGDDVNGWKVTSPFGKRESPCKGCSSDHKGTDIATVTGTPLYIPARNPNHILKDMEGEEFLFRCRTPEETGGGGLVAELLMVERGVMYQALHLSKCGIPVGAAGGHQFAETGDSGLGTGAHVDLRKIITNAQDFQSVDRSGKSHVPITKYEAHWILKGVTPKSE